MKKHIGSAAALALLVFVALACNSSFTTANISELKFSPNENGTPSATSFKAGDDIYALATVSNAGGKYKLKWRMTYEDVPGKGKGEEIGTKTIDFEDSSQLWQQFSSPLPGKYGVEATLMDEDGKKEIDKKTGTVTISGSSDDS